MDAYYSTNMVDVLEYTVPEGKTGIITVTYQAKIVDKATMNNLGYYGDQHLLNHATTSKGGSGDTDIVVKYGDQPEPHIEKSGENQTRTEEDWQPGDRIKWTVVFGDATTDMRGKVLQDTMNFLQTLDTTTGVSITIGGTTTTMPTATDRWNGNGVIYGTDDNVNQGNYGAYTEVPVFRYTVENGSDPIMGPITVVYYTTIIGQGDAWDHNVTGMVNVYNKAGETGNQREF